MQPFGHFPENQLAAIRYVLTDIDDTLTVSGRLVADAYLAMEQLAAAGISVIPVTGRPAGWCDHIARMWPIDGLVGENGAFYFRYDRHRHKMIRRYWKSEKQRLADRKELESIKAKILAAFPGCRVSADQEFRQADLAIDFCEDVKRLPAQAVAAIADCFIQAGAQAKISSIHVNGWFGDYDKLAMTKCMFAEAFQQNLDEIEKQVIFVGDSPNDVPMFSYFSNSVGVANVLDFAEVLDAKPTWITEAEGGYGFAQMAAALLSAKPLFRPNQGIAHPK